MGPGGNTNLVKIHLIETKMASSEETDFVMLPVIMFNPFLVVLLAMLK